MKLSDYVFNFIARQGVKHVFMLPGGGAMHLVDSLGRNPDIEFVANLHEQASAIAAEAYAEVTGNLGVALVTSGPGATNAITGVAAAWLESTPCLVISGQVKRADLKGDSGLRQLGLQELDIVEIVKTMTKYAVAVTDPATIRFHLEKAMANARSGRPGPVWIDIPLDVQASQIDPDQLPGFAMPTEERDSTSASVRGQVASTFEFLNAAERPVLLGGGGVRIGGAARDFRRLADLLGIPVLTTWKGTDLLYDAHPLYFGKPGVVASRGANFLIQNSDCLISLGARLDFAVTGFDQRNFARAARKIVVDIDVAEINKLRMNIDVPICADAGLFIREMLRQSASLDSRKRSEWMTACAEWKRKYPVVLPDYWRAAEYVNPYVLADAISEEAVGEDLFIPGSSGAGIDTFWLALKMKEGQRAFSAGGLGAMGFGIPASIGGCLGSGRRRTITVDGDGGFQLNSQELETVSRLGLPIKYFVLNNQGYASIRGMQHTHFRGRLVACDATSGLTLPDTIRLAAAYGIEATRICNHDRLRERVRDVLATPGPVVCDVMVDPNKPVAPRVSSAVRPDGSMASRPLEDLWPFLDRDEFRANMIVPPLED